MRDFKRMVVGLGAGTRSKTRDFRFVPVVVEIEDMLRKSGAAWSALYEAKINAASLALFGITPDQVKTPEPHPDSFGRDDRHSQIIFSAGARADYEIALAAWYEWENKVAVYEAEIARRGAVNYWLGRGFDVSDGCGAELRCFPDLSRQLFAAVYEAIPGARVTLDGSGKRAAQSADEWGAALAAAAARFKRSS